MYIYVDICIYSWFSNVHDFEVEFTKLSWNKETSVKKTIETILSIINYRCTRLQGGAP